VLYHFVYRFFGPWLEPARATLPEAEARAGQIMVPGSAS
jgi:hypothetical protein